MNHNPELFERTVLNRVEQLRREARVHDQLQLAQANPWSSGFARLAERLAGLRGGMDRGATAADEARRDGACEVACPERLAGTCRCAQLGHAL